MKLRQPHRLGARASHGASPAKGRAGHRGAPSAKGRRGASPAKGRVGHRNDPPAKGRAPRPHSDEEHVVQHLDGSGKRPLAAAGGFQIAHCSGG
jgi:hypothetical protein